MITKIYPISFGFNTKISGNKKINKYDVPSFGNKRLKARTLEEAAELLKANIGKPVKLPDDLEPTGFLRHMKVILVELKGAVTSHSLRLTHRNPKIRVDESTSRKPINLGEKSLSQVLGEVIEDTATSLKGSFGEGDTIA